MPFRTLSLILDAIAKDTFSVRPDAGVVPDNNRAENDAALRKATVLAVNSISGAQLQIGSQFIEAVQATDEPLRAGSQVWVSRAEDGTYVIHGSV